ncbi:MAG: EamA family transporter [Lachnospiraceae bacterium]
MKTEISPKRLILLQAVVILYTLSSVMAKFASGEEALEKIVFFFGMDLFFLGLYALFWQQLIKALPLSVAYANRAMALLWSALWARLIFDEKIGVKQIAGIVLVIIGILIINGDKKESEREGE